MSVDLPGRTPAPQICGRLPSGLQTRLNKRAGGASELKCLFSFTSLSVFSPVSVRFFFFTPSWLPRECRLKQHLRGVGPRYPPQFPLLSLRMRPPAPACQPGALPPWAPASGGSRPSTQQAPQHSDRHPLCGPCQPFRGGGGVRGRPPACHPMQLCMALASLSH